MKNGVLPGNTPGEKVCSPRMRGCSRDCHPLHRHTGVFPAYAGVFRARRVGTPALVSVPRVCGGVPQRRTAAVSPPRCSPRMRGCSPRELPAHQRQEVFPAYAGVFPALTVFGAQLVRVPRVCGGVPETAWQVMAAAECSPRMRGCSLLALRCGRP